jgi:hypothetical protein
LAGAWVDQHQSRDLLPQTHLFPLTLPLALIEARENRAELAARFRFGHAVQIEFDEGEGAARLVGVAFQKTSGPCAEIDRADRGDVAERRLHLYPKRFEKHRLREPCRGRVIELDRKVEKTGAVFICGAR